MTASVARVERPRFDHREPVGRVLGVGTGTPRLSWRIETDNAQFSQTKAQIEVTTHGSVATYLVEGDQQVLVPWPGEPLLSRQSATVRVRVASEGSWSDFSPAATVETGLLRHSDWTAAFVSPESIAGLDEPAPQVRRTFEIPGEVAHARLYATAHGIFAATVNGREVDETVLAPGWTAYEARLRYHTYDVTSLVQEGMNEIAAVLGNGWYRGYLGYMGGRAIYGDRLAFLGQLEVTTTDGRVHIVNTDSSWSARETVIVADDLYNGQATDLRRAHMAMPDCAVEVLDTDHSVLVAPDGPAMARTGVRPAQRVWTSPCGATLVDFGQNAVGWVRLTARGVGEGTEVVVRHAEVLENDELGTRPLRSAAATDRWVLDGRDSVELEPTLTLHGFRYAQVDGIPDLRAEDIEMVVVGTQLERTGWFDSSHELLNRLHENVVWSTRSNFVDLPTDCPQRDERLGWTGDIQVFGPTAMFLFDLSGLLTNWLADLSAEQLPDGTVPHVIPNCFLDGPRDPDAAAWGDAATIVPWTVYERTGDVALLARQLPSMRAWVDREAHLAGDDLLWTGGFQFGDWLDPTAPPEAPGAGKAAAEVVATAHFARSAWIVSQALAVVGDRAGAARYGDLAENVRRAWVNAYVTPSGRIVSEAQTVYALAIAWDLLSTDIQRAGAGEQLADLVRASGFRIATGFVGTPLICDALTKAGHVDLAHRLLLQTACPSWLYPVSMGATTVWERWDSMLPDGSINPGEMTSFNHYALGAVADWMQRSIAGLAPAAPGYRRVHIAPVPPQALDHASARHLSPYGEISVAWKREAGGITVSVHVPPGVEADIALPDRPLFTVGAGDHSWRSTVAASAPAAPETIRDLIDLEPAWLRVVAATTRGGISPDGEEQVLGWVRDYLDFPASFVMEAIVQQLHPHDRFGPDHPLYREVMAIVEGAAEQRAA
ncbi:family 78 glycoside hydrolase catalytic domain [Demequina sp.]|uniref:family 78 glycoside hydrolase catalytic domain n=1 Tax=Demequina sp. TaxID=2050685 RepID=UPI003A89B82B